MIKRRRTLAQKATDPPKLTPKKKDKKTAKLRIGGSTE